MGPLVQFIAQMVEYNETLTLYRTFIEKIDFFLKFFSIQGTSGTILRALGAVWDRNFNEKRWFKRVLQKMTPKPRKSFLTTLFWMIFFAESDSGIEKIENPVKH